MTDSDERIPAPHSRRGSRAARAARPARPASARRRRLGCLTAGGVIVAVLATVAGAAWWTLYRAEASVDPGRTVRVEIARGASTAAVGRALAEKGVVANATMFGLQVRSEGAASNLKPGVYEFTTGSDYASVISALQAGPTIVYHSLAIPEGWTIPQVARRVQDKTGISAAEFERIAATRASDFDFAFLEGASGGSLEGYLFPKTYRVRQGSTAADVIRMMLAQYERETTGLDLSYAKSRNLTPRDVLIVASIIEREARVPTDRPLVASVVYNRLKRRMRLEMCATVQYVLGGKPKLSYADLKVDSPYNTYEHAGLPPGPICSPGLASIRAAASPASTKYLYYVLTGKDGSHSFTGDYDTFLRLKVQAAKGLK